MTGHRATRIGAGTLLFALSRAANVALADLGIAVNALAMGLWFMLAIYWARHRVGVTRVALVWAAVNVIATMVLRTFAQVTNWAHELHNFDMATRIRLFFRIASSLSFALLAVYMIKNKTGVERNQDFKDGERG